jgi:small subunit ribosomal protein S6
MRRYETIVILHPSLSQEDRQPFFDKVNSLIPEPQGLLIKLDEWGQKRLAYEIKKQTRGFYLLAEYCGDGDLVRELERNLRLDDRALKYMTVCIDPDVNLEKIKADIEAAKQEEAEALRAAEKEASDSAEAQYEPSEETAEQASGETSEPESTPEQTNEEEPANGSV